LNAVADIEEAILAQRKVLGNSSDGSAWTTGVTFGRNNLSLSLISRLNYTGDIDDIDEAIVLQNKVIELIETGPEGHPKMTT